MTAPEPVRRVLADPCACRGQCGKPHIGGGPCGHLPRWDEKHVAAPADPSAPYAPDAVLLSWCGPCYSRAERTGREARAAAREEQHAAAQSPLF